MNQYLWSNYLRLTFEIGGTMSEKVDEAEEHPTAWPGDFSVLDPFLFLKPLVFLTSYKHPCMPAIIVICCYFQVKSWKN